MTNLRIVNAIFIYALCEPGTRTVRYIGKTQNLKERFSQHIRTSVKMASHLGAWLRKLARLGVSPNMVLLCEVPEDESASVEIKYIRIAQKSLGMDLVNESPGGEGMTPTLESRAKQRAAWTPERRAAQAARMAAAKGLPQSPKHRAAIKAACDKKRAETGRCEGAPPYELVSEEGKRAVEFIVAARGRGDSYNKIARDLNNGGFKSARGGCWAMSLVHKMFRRYQKTHDNLSGQTQN